MKVKSLFVCISWTIFFLFNMACVKDCLNVDSVVKNKKKKDIEKVKENNTVKKEKHKKDKWRNCEYNSCSLR